MFVQFTQLVKSTTTLSPLMVITDKYFVWSYGKMEDRRKYIYFQEKENILKTYLAGIFRIFKTN